jgi:hypothetical protein
MIRKIRGAGITRTCVKLILELVNVRYGTRQPVNALDVQTKQVHSLDALIDHHRNGQPVSLIKLG